MALKPDRILTDSSTDISFFCNLGTAERGTVVILSACGSGAAMDDSAAVVTYPTVAYASGEYPLGILMNDVVSGDLTKTHLNQHKDEVQTGGKVTICRRGVVVTNMIDAGVNPTVGQPAYAGSSKDGKLTAQSLGSSTNYNVATGIAAGANLTGVYANMWLTNQGGVATNGLVNNPAMTRIGTWLSSKDVDGYAKLSVNLI